MKSYKKLTEAQKAEARERALNSLVGALCAGALTFDDSEDDALQERVDEAITEAESCQAPGFAGECILKTCREELERKALCDAENTLYLEPGEYAIRLSAM